MIETRQELREQRRWFIRQAWEIGDRLFKEKRLLTPEEMRDFDAYHDEAKAVEKRMAWAVDEILDRDPERTAIHEAGHAVACVLGGVNIRVAELRGPGWLEDPTLRNLLGVVFHRKTAHGGLRWSEIMLAGIAAERIAGYGPEGGDAEFRDAAEEIGTEQALEELRHIRGRLRDHWPAVEAVADVLRRDGRIDGPEVKEIVEDMRPVEMSPAERAARLDAWRRARA